MNVFMMKNFCWKSSVSDQMDVLFVVYYIISNNSYRTFIKWNIGEMIPKVRVILFRIVETTEECFILTCVQYILFSQVIL